MAHFRIENLQESEKMGVVQLTQRQLGMIKRHLRVEDWLLSKAT